MTSPNTLAPRQRKIIIIALGAFLVLTILIARLAMLQVINRDYYRERSMRNYTRITPIAPTRGALFDRHGTLVASNTAQYDLVWHGSGGKLRHGEIERFVETINKQLEDAALDAGMLKKLKRADRQGRAFTIATNLDFETLCAITESVPGAPLETNTQFKRHYPGGRDGCQILGHLTRQDSTGACGIESVLENALQGTPGTTTHMTNARGRRLKELDVQPALHGHDVRLTIDMQAQHLAARLFEPDAAGALVLLDPISGDVRCLHSNPTFDPNMFSAPIPTSVWNEVNANNPFLNRACRALYPPASLFKLITFTTGLETGAITPETIFPCQGYSEFGGRRYHCLRRWGHGEISLTRAIAVSCNVPCYEIGKLITIDDLADCASRFGLGRSSESMLDDRSGLVPTSRWKRATKGEQWWPGETLSACIGQTYLLVTPLQIARMLGGIFTGMLVRPRMVLDEPVQRETIDVLPSTLQFVQNAMYEVAQRGSARSFGTLKDFTVFAKTGTAQTSGLHKAKKSRNDYEHAWFSCCFSYKNERPLVLVVLVEHAGSSKPAALIAKKFLEGFRELSQI